MVNLKDFLSSLLQEPQDTSETLSRAGSTRDLSFAHEPAPDIWLEILPFLDEKAEVPPELLQD